MITPLFAWRLCVALVRGACAWRLCAALVRGACAWRLCVTLVRGACARRLCAALTRYECCLRFHTGSRATASEVHAVGLSEVERIGDEMRLACAAAGMEAGGDVKAFLAALKTDPRFTPKDGARKNLWLGSARSASCPPPHIF